MAKVALLVGATLLALVPGCIQEDRPSPNDDPDPEDPVEAYAYEWLGSFDGWMGWQFHAQLDGASCTYDIFMTGTHEGSSPVFYDAIYHAGAGGGRFTSMGIVDGASSVMLNDQDRVAPPAFQAWRMASSGTLQGGNGTAETLTVVARDVRQLEGEQDPFIRVDCEDALDVEVTVESQEARLYNVVSGGPSIQVPAARYGATHVWHNTTTFADIHAIITEQDVGATKSHIEGRLPQETFAVSSESVRMGHRTISDPGTLQFTVSAEGPGAPLALVMVFPGTLERPV